MCLAMMFSSSRHTCPARPRHRKPSWNAYTKWLIDQGVVTDAKDQVVKTPDSKPYFSNDLLGGQ